MGAGHNFGSSYRQPSIAINLPEWNPIPSLNIQFKIRKDFSENKASVFESIFIELLKGHKSKSGTVLGEVYRPLTSNLKHFCEINEELPSKIPNYRSNVIIGADQNLDLLRAKEHLPVDTSNVISACKSKVVTTDVFDHFPILLINNLPKPYLNLLHSNSPRVTLLKQHWTT